MVCDAVLGKAVSVPADVGELASRLEPLCGEANRFVRVQWLMGSAAVTVAALTLLSWTVFRHRRKANQFIRFAALTLFTAFNLFLWSRFSAFRIPGVPGLSAKSTKEIPQMETYPGAVIQRGAQICLTLGSVAMFTLWAIMGSSQMFAYLQSAPPRSRGEEQVPLATSTGRYPFWALQRGDAF